MVEALGAQDLRITVGAVCVYHNLVATAVEALQGTDIPVAAVSTGFPAAQNPLKLKIEEIKESVQAGAREIDIVIPPAHCPTGNWQGPCHRVRALLASSRDA